MLTLALQRFGASGSGANGSSAVHESPLRRDALMRLEALRGAEVEAGVLEYALELGAAWEIAVVVRPRRRAEDGTPPRRDAVLRSDAVLEQATAGRGGRFRFEVVGALGPDRLVEITRIAGPETAPDAAPFVPILLRMTPAGAALLEAPRGRHAAGSEARAVLLAETGIALPGPFDETAPGDAPALESLEGRAVCERLDLEDRGRAELLGGEIVTELDSGSAVAESCLYERRVLVGRHWQGVGESLAIRRLEFPTARPELATGTATLREIFSARRDEATTAEADLLLEIAQEARGLEGR